MTSKRRQRKTAAKRRNTDDDSYAQRYRTASDAAKEARRDHPAGKGLKEFGKTIDIGRIHSVGIVPQGQGWPGSFIEAVGHEPIIRDAQEAVCEEAAFDTAAAHRERAAARTPGQPAAESRAEPPRRETSSFPKGPAIAVEGLRPVAPGYTYEQQRALREKWEAGRRKAPEEDLPEPPTAEQVLEWVRDTARAAREEYRRGHWVYAEATVKGLPKHVGTASCYCKIASNHWVVIEGEF